MNALGVEILPVEYKKYATRDKGIIDGFYEQFEIFKETIEYIKDKIIIKTFNEVFNQFDTLVFESSVGLAMAGKNNAIVNKTCSNVGVKNCLALLHDYEYEGEACYISRSYLVKHGAGDFPEEDTTMLFHDSVNVDDYLQGKMRFGPLNYTEYIERCKEDFSQCDSK